MKKVLLVEDEELYRRIVSIGLRPLEQKGKIEVDYAGSAKEAIDLINKKHYDVVITDGVLNGQGRDDNIFEGSLVAKLAKEKGAFTVGISSEPEKFKNLAGDNIDVNYHKPINVIALSYIIDNQPKQEEFDKKAREEGWE